MRCRKSPGDSEFPLLAIGSDLEDVLKCQGCLLTHVMRTRHTHTSYVPRGVGRRTDSEFIEARKLALPSQVSTRAVVNLGMALGLTGNGQGRATLCKTVEKTKRQAPRDLQSSKRDMGHRKKNVNNSFRCKSLRWAGRRRERLDYSTVPSQTISTSLLRWKTMGSRFERRVRVFLL